MISRCFNRLFLIFKIFINFRTETGARLVY